MEIPNNFKSSLDGETLNTQLRFAISIGSNEMVDFLLSNGINPNEGNERFNIIPCYYSMYETFAKHGVDFGSNRKFLSAVLSHIEWDPHDLDNYAFSNADKILRLVLLHNCDFCIDAERYKKRCKIKNNKASRYMFVTINLWMVYLMLYCFNKRNLNPLNLDMSAFNLSPDNLSLCNWRIENGEKIYEKYLRHDFDYSDSDSDSDSDY